MSSSLNVASRAFGISFGFYGETRFNILGVSVIGNMLVTFCAEWIYKKKWTSHQMPLTCLFWGVETFLQWIERGKGRNYQWIRIVAYSPWLKCSGEIRTISLLIRHYSTQMTVNVSLKKRGFYLQIDSIFYQMSREAQEIRGIKTVPRSIVAGGYFSGKT